MQCMGCKSPSQSLFSVTRLGLKQAAKEEAEKADRLRKSADKRAQTRLDAELERISNENRAAEQSNRERRLQQQLDAASGETRRAEAALEAAQREMVLLSAAAAVQQEQLEALRSEVRSLKCSVWRYEAQERASR